MGIKPAWLRPVAIACQLAGAAFMLLFLAIERPVAQAQGYAVRAVPASSGLQAVAVLVALVFGVLVLRRRSSTLRLGVATSVLVFLLLGLQHWPSFHSGDPSAITALVGLQTGGLILLALAAPILLFNRARPLAHLA
jgi:hypothetical protein